MKPRTAASAFAIVIVAVVCGGRGVTRKERHGTAFIIGGVFYIIIYYLSGDTT